ncbi:MAG: hypothetical protein KIH01_06015 [Candidatus Freyarchaeota archaeon]|nr:hypothetical protein [Candidatus Jordarchaeia archaeon]
MIGGRRMPIRRKEELGGGKEKLELSVVKEGIDKIANMMSRYVGEVERRLEVLEKMFFGIERRITDVEGRVSLVERRMGEHLAEERGIRVPSSLVEAVRAQPPSVSFVEKEEKKEGVELQAHPMEEVTLKEEEGVDEDVEIEEEWEPTEGGKFTSVVEEFKKLLSEDSDKEGK